jgi:hypothetical protein
VQVPEIVTVLATDRSNFAIAAVIVCFLLQSTVAVAASVGATGTARSRAAGAASFHTFILFSLCVCFGLDAGHAGWSNWTTREFELQA